jgi:hypothetical protein
MKKFEEEKKTCKIGKKHCIKKHHVKAKESKVASKLSRKIKKHFF